MYWKSIFGFLSAACAIGALSGIPIAEAFAPPTGEIGLVPKPVRTEMGAGSFPLSAQCTIRFESRLAGAKPTAEYLAAMLRSGLGFPFQVRQGDNAKGGAILLTSVGANESLG